VKRFAAVYLALLLALIPVGIEAVPAAGARPGGGVARKGTVPAKCKRPGLGGGWASRRRRGCPAPVRPTVDAVTAPTPIPLSPAAPATPQALPTVVPTAVTPPPGGKSPAPAPMPPAPIPPVSTPPAPTPFTAQAPERFFSPSSFWNTPVPADAPLDSSSDAIVASLAGEVAAERIAHKGPSVITTEYSVPIYTVGPDQATEEVRLESPYSARSLRAAWAAVPMPATAQAARGRDGHLLLWQPSSDRLWEFWHLAGGPGDWRADWGGAIDRVSESSGAYGPAAWPGASPSWGASASSLSIAGGLITLRDLERGSIDHALAMSLRDVRAQTFFFPARRTDGESSDPLALPEGAHLRLDPSLDIASLHLPPLARMMAEAAQRYGIFIRDVAANVTFYAQDPINVGANPYLGPGGFFEGSYPQALLASFPWTSLELLAPPPGP
jgi:hypothetical protein